MSSILVLAVKDLRLLFRDKFGLFWIFAFPLMYTLFFGMIFGGSDDDSRASISIAIVDEDGSAGSGRLVERLADHESLAVSREGEGELAAPRLATLEDARAQVRRGDRMAYVRIPAGYGDEPFALFGGGGDEEAPKLEVGIDPSRKAEAGFLQGILMEVVFGGFTDSFGDKEFMHEQITRAKDEISAMADLDAGQKLVLRTFMGALDEFFEGADMSALTEGEGGGGFGGMDPVEVIEVTRELGERPRSAFEITFPQAMIWGLMGVAMGFAITLVRERTAGTLLRLKIAPIGRAQLFAGKALACMITCIIVMVFLLGFGAVTLGVRVGNPLLLAMAMTSTAICFTGVMMVASVLGKTEQAVAGASWGVMMPFAMIGGGMIPLIAMPSWLVKVSNISPFKWGIYSMEGAIWRGFTVGDMLMPCAILIAIGVVFFGIGVRLFRSMDG